MTDSVTLEELQWQGVGWDRLTDDQRIALLEDRLAQCAWGVIDMNADRIRASQALLNKYRGDKKAVELSTRDGKPLQVVHMIKLVSL